MTDTTVETEAADGSELSRVTALLGGEEIFRRPVHTSLDAHEVLLEGLPARTLSALIDNLVLVEWSGPLERALGTSLRTFQRRRGTPGRRLSREQSARTWKFAEVLARATAVLGTQEQAERWLERPAIALDGRRPIDLLATPAGTGLVEDLLTRLEYGVYM